MESISHSLDRKLYESSFAGDLEGVMAALAQGGRVSCRNFQGFTPLLIAAQNGHADICGLLLAHGSDVNEILPENRLTALWLAAHYNHKTVAKALISWGASVNQRCSQGLTPLLTAAQNGHTDIIVGKSVFASGNLFFEAEFS